MTCRQHRSVSSIRLLVAACAVVVLSSIVLPAETPQPEDATVDQVEQLGDEARELLIRMYDYDRTIPLEARIVERRERDGVIREKIVFRGAQGFLVPGYLEYAQESPAPRACVLLLHGWSGSKEAWWQDDNYISGGNSRRALVDAGYAVLALDAQCHGDRIAENDFAPVNHFAAEGDPQPRKGYFTLNEIYLQTTRDYRRAIDYLETREDVDASRVAVLGYSMGGTQTYLLTGTEPRIKVAVSVAAPAEKSKWSPVAPQNFVGGIGERPFLAIMGDRDEMCPLPYARARHDLFAGTHNRQLIIEGGHRLPSTWVPDAIDWIKANL